MEGSMKKLVFASGALVALIAAGPAMAADREIRAPAPAYAPVSDWSGFYVGGHAGYGWGDDPFNMVLFGNDVNGAGNSSLNTPGVSLNGIKPKGFVGGFHFGYNQQWSNWVGGLEIDISGTDMKGSTANTATGSFTNVFGPGVTPVTNTVSVTDKFDLLGSARARLGVLTWPNVLLYGTGGLAWTHFVQNLNETITTGGPSPLIQTLTTSNHIAAFGWVAGAGGEAKIYNSNWLFRVEYLHYDFGDRGGFTANSTIAGTGSASASTILGRLTADVVRAGISYKFGGNPI
jgi:opacity protein-like surface antigen